MKVIVETTDAQQAASITAAVDNALEANTFEEFISTLCRLLPYGLTAGRSGSHVWISNVKTLERKALILTSIN